MLSFHPSINTMSRTQETPHLRDTKEASYMYVFKSQRDIRYRAGIKTRGIQVYQSLPTSSHLRQRMTGTPQTI